MIHWQNNTFLTLVENEQDGEPPRMAKTIFPVELIVNGWQASNGTLSIRFPTIELL